LCRFFLFFNLGTLGDLNFLTGGRKKPFGVIRLRPAKLFSRLAEKLETGRMGGQGTDGPRYRPTYCYVSIDLFYYLQEFTGGNQ
jgi:hypothetical protein